MSTTQTENLLRDSYTKLSPQERQKLWESGQHNSKDAFTFYFMYNNYFDHRIFLDEHRGRALPYALGCLKGWQWLITEQGKPNIRQAFQYHQKNRTPGKKELFSHHHDDDRKKLLPTSYAKEQAYNYLDPCVWGWVLIISPETEDFLDLKYLPSHFKRTETVICRNHPENTMYTHEVMFYFDLRNTTECIGRSLVDDQQEGHRWRTGMVQIQLAGAPQWWYYLVTQCLMGKGGRAENIVIENEWEGEQEDPRPGMSQLPLRNTSPIPLDEEVGDDQPLEQDVDVEMNERPALNIVKKKTTTGMEPPPQRKHHHVMYVKNNPKNMTGNVVGSVHRVHRVAARADQRAPAGQIYRGRMQPPSASVSFAPPTVIQGSSIQRPDSISGRPVSPPICQKLYRTGDLPGQNHQTQQDVPSELQQVVSQNQSQQNQPQNTQVSSPHVQLQQQVSARAAQPPFPLAMSQNLSQQKAPGITRPSRAPTSQAEQQRVPTYTRQRQSSIVHSQQQQFLNNVAATAQFLEGRIRHAGGQLSAEQKLKLHEIQQKTAEIKSMAAQPQNTQAIPKPTKEPQPPVATAVKMAPIGQKPVSSLQGAQFNPPSHKFSTQRHASLQPPQVPSWAAGIARPMSAMQTHTESNPHSVENHQLSRSVEESEMHDTFTPDPASHSQQQNSGIQARSSSTDMTPGPDNGENQKHTSVSIVPNHKYKCRVQGCGQTFASSQGLHRHRKGHTPEEMATSDPPVSKSGRRKSLKRKSSNGSSSAISRQRPSDSLSKNASGERDLSQTKTLPSQSKHAAEPRGIIASSLTQSTSTNSQRPHAPSSLSQSISAGSQHPEMSSRSPLVSPQLPRHISHVSQGPKGMQPPAKLGSSPAKPVFVGGPQNSSSPMMAPRLPGMGDFSPQKRSGSMKTDTPPFPYSKRRPSVTNLGSSPPKMAIPQGSSQIRRRPSSVPSSMQPSTMMAQDSSLAQPQPNSSSIAPASMTGIRMEQRQSPRPVRGLSSSGRYFETMPGPSWMAKHRRAAMGPPPGGVARPMPPNPSNNPYLQNPLLPPQQQDRSSPAITSSPDRTISENPSPVPPPSTPPPQRHPSNSIFRSSPPQMLVRGPSQEPPSPTDAVARRHAMHRGAQHEKERF